MKKNVGSFGIHQFHSNDDPFIPVSESRHVAKKIGSQYFELPERSHFFDAPFPELIKTIADNMENKQSDKPSVEQMMKEMIEQEGVK